MIVRKTRIGERMGRRKKTTEAELLAPVPVGRFEPLALDDPTQWLEHRRPEYIRRIEQNADWARADGDRDGELKALAYLTRLTSLYKQRIDVKSTHLGLIKAPDLSKLSKDELSLLENADAEALAGIASKIVGSGEGS